MPDSQMGAEALIRLTKPLTYNRRIFGFVIIALLISGAMALLYHLQIKSNQENFYNYGQAMLLSQQDQIFEIYDNKVLAAKATNKSLNQNNLKSLIEKNAQGLTSYSAFEDYIIQLQVSYRSEKFDIFISSIRGLRGPLSDESIPRGPLGLGSLEFDFRINNAEPHVLMTKAFEMTSEIYPDSSMIEGIVVGLISQKDYRKNTRSLSPALITFLTALLVILILGVPFLKMAFITRYERITTTDIIWSGISLLLGIPVLISLVLIGCYYNYEKNDKIPDELSKLNARITQNLVKQIKYVNPLDKFNFTSDQTSDTFVVDTPNLGQTLQSLNFKLVSCVTTAGNVLQTVSRFRFPPDIDSINIWNRSYFTDLRTGRHVWSYDYSGTVREFVMRPVVSIEDQSEESVFIIPDSDPSDSCAYKIASALLSSVQEHRVSPGYTHLVIDPSGLVYYHTEKGRSTLENFLDVSSDTAGIVSSIHTVTPSAGTVTYHNDKYLYNIMPVQNTHLYSITLYEQSRITRKAAQVLSLIWEFLIPIFFINIFVITLCSWNMSKKRPHSGVLSKLAYLIPRRDRLHQFKHAYRWCIGGILLIFAIALILPKAIIIISLVIAPFISIPIIAQLTRKTKSINEEIDVSIIKNKNPRTETSYYTPTIYSWLITIVAIPCLLVFVYSVQCINDLELRNELYHSALQWHHLKHSLEDQLPTIQTSKSELEHFKQRLLQSGNYSIEVESDSTINCDEANDFRSTLNDVAIRMMPTFGQAQTSSVGLLNNEAPDGEWCFGRSDDTLHLRIQPRTYQDEYTLSAAVPPVMGSIAWKVYTFISIAVLLILLYSMYRYTTRRLLGQDFDAIRPITNSEREAYMSEFSKVFASDKTVASLLIIGPPHAGKLDFAQGITSQYNHISLLNFNIDPSLKVSSQIKALARGRELDPSCDNYVITNLEHNLKSIDWNRRKLQIITYLLSERKNIIITSEVYPDQILGFYEDQEDEQDQLNESLANDYSAWRDTLSAFPHLVLGIQDDRSFCDKSIDTYCKYPNDPIVAIGSQVNISQTVSRIDLTSLNKQTVHQGYYADIWNSLPVREQYILYDLAEDHFANTKNALSIFSLMRKGIIRYSGRLEIFDPAFADYILAAIPQKQALKLERAERSAGSWGTIRVVLYMVLATVAVFLLLSNPDITRNAQQLTSAFAGAGAFLTLLVNLLARGGAKAS